MKVIFDLDDTICRTMNRDYANASAIGEVVAKIRELRQTVPDVHIAIHTSRGMASCNGDVQAVEAKNRSTIEHWLRSHHIHVDEIIFGKPLADIYVDDKGMSAVEFSKSKVRRYYGFSGASVIRVGRTIIKEAENVARQAAWYREAARHYATMQETYYKHGLGAITVPEVYSLTLGKLYEQFVSGYSAVKMVNETMVCNLIDALVLEPALPGENDLEAYADYVEDRADSIGLRTDIGDRIRECELLKRRTFCHGDFSLQNIICTKEGFALIDPSPKDGISSWILDAGKLRASLTCLDEALAKTTHPTSQVWALDSQIASHTVSNDVPLGTKDAILLAEESHIIRVWYYAKKLGKKRQEQIIAQHYKEVYGSRAK